MHAIWHYLFIVITDGDALNDWLTHMPEPVAHLMLTIGTLISQTCLS